MTRTVFVHEAAAEENRRAGPLLRGASRRSDRAPVRCRNRADLPRPRRGSIGRREPLALYRYLTTKLALALPTFPAASATRIASVCVPFARLGRSTRSSSVWSSHRPSAEAP